MRKNWIRTLLMGLSFTSVLFVFQACYGTPQDFGADILVEGIVKAKPSGNALSGIKVTIEMPGQDKQYAYTNESGKFSMYTLPYGSIPVNFCDTVGTFLPKDTVLLNKGNNLFISIELEPGN